jgi:hypothetical protein
MTRNCDVCGLSYDAKRPSSRYCSSKCRERNHRKPADDKRPRSLDDLGEMRASDLISTTQAALEAADRIDTFLGQQALLLARKIGAPMDTGSSTAALSREYRAVMTDALKGASVVADTLDELKARRDLKRNAG